MNKESLQELIVDDLAGGVPILQRAALYRLLKMADDDFEQTIRVCSQNQQIQKDQTIRKAFLEIMRQRKTAVSEKPLPIESLAGKTEEEMIRDWKSGDPRIKLAILSQLEAHDLEIRRTVRTLGMQDDNPVVRLEAENLDPEKYKEQEKSELDRVAWIEELGGENPPQRIAPLTKETRVLVVDDSATVQRIMGGYLQSHVQLEQATSVAEGWLKIQNQEFDLVFMDISLGDGSGLDLLFRCREAGFDGAIVMISTLDTEHIIRTAFINGANHFIIKNDLVEMIGSQRLLEYLPWYKVTAS